LNSRHHACKASTLLLEPQLLVFSLLVQYQLRNRQGNQIQMTIAAVLLVELDWKAWLELVTIGSF
jgi:hypothetical protein